MSGTAILTRPVDVARLPAHPVEIVANATERARIAAAYDLQAVKDFHATVELFPGPRGSVKVEGRVVADIVQTCVVSLVAVEAHIDEPLALRFVRPEDAPAVPKAGAEILVDADRPDPPEIIEGPTIDIGAVAEEAFALAIDPYPRAPDATLPKELESGAGGAADSPFAILAGLRKPQTGDG